jgi:hypothetical protein
VGLRPVEAVRADGTGIVVADRDPGFGNWMDTAGHQHGTMGLRWVRAAADVRPSTELITLTG